MSVATYIWRDPDGVDHQISGLNPAQFPYFEVEEGFSGQFVPPRSVTRKAVAFQPGSRTRTIRTETREMDVPLVVAERDRAALYTTVEDVATWFALYDDPERTGQFIHIRPDGTTRYVDAHYQSGLEGRGGGGTSGPDWQRFPLVLASDDPFWYAEEIRHAWGLNEPVTRFFPTGIPLRLTGAALFASPLIFNPGHRETWPIWTIRGPGNELVLRNLTTGELLRYGVTLGAGEALTIDTRPRRKFAQHSDGTRRYAQAGSWLWALARGPNQLQIEYSGTR